MSTGRDSAVAAKNNTTYRMGMMQSHAYRILKTRTNSALAPLGITSVHWALLGLLLEQGSMRLRDIASELGVEAPFVTTLVRNLSKRNLVVTGPDLRDSRAKCVTLTSSGVRFVPDTEKQLRGAMRGLINGVPDAEIASYVRVLASIIKNGEQD